MADIVLIMAILFCIFAGLAIKFPWLLVVAAVLCVIGMVKKEYDGAGNQDQ